MCKIVPMICEIAPMMCYVLKSSVKNSFLRVFTPFYAWLIGTFVCVLWSIWCVFDVLWCVFYDVCFMIHIWCIYDVYLMCIWCVDHNKVCMCPSYEKRMGRKRSRHISNVFPYCDIPQGFDYEQPNQNHTINRFNRNFKDGHLYKIGMRHKCGTQSTT